MLCRTDQKITITFSELLAINPAETLQLQHFITISTNPEDYNMPNLFRHSEISLAKEPLKAQQVLLECSSDIDKVRRISGTEHLQSSKSP